MNLSDYVGLPFAPRGRERDGLDCWGLVALVYRERLGVDLPSYVDRYLTTADGAALAAIISGELGPWRDVEAGRERPGDALLMSLGGQPRHIGVVVGGGNVLHIERGAGSVLQSYRSRLLSHRVMGFFRHESLA